MQKTKTLLIDVNNYLKRIYHGGGDPYGLFTGLMNKNTTSEVILVCDTFTSRKHRKDILDTYKAGRPQGDDPIYWELYNNAITIGRHYPNASVIKVTHGEADDYILLNAKAGDDVISNDKDLWPLIAKDVNILLNATSKVDRQLIEVKFFYPDPELIVAYKCLVGDSSDKIIGKFRFGIAAYKKLSKEYLYDFLACLESNKEHELIDENVKTSYALVKTFQDITYESMEPLEFSELNKFYTSKGIIC